MKEFWRFIEYAIIFVIILIILFSFIIGIKMVPNNDMFPRLSSGDLMFYYKLDKSILPQDLVVLEKNNTEYVGRVIAKEGDSIEITKDETVMINGNQAVESNIFYTTPQYEGFVEYPITLSKNEYFILCDKREGEEDSRYYGPVNINEIKGTVVGIFRRGGF